MSANQTGLVPEKRYLLDRGEDANSPLPGNLRRKPHEATGFKTDAGHAAFAHVFRDPGFLYDQVGILGRAIAETCGFSGQRIGPDGGIQQKLCRAQGDMKPHAIFKGTHNLWQRCRQSSQRRGRSIQAGTGSNGSETCAPNHFRVRTSRRFP